MIAAGMFGREQKEKQIDRLVVVALEFDGFIETGKQADDALAGP